MQKIILQQFCFSPYSVDFLAEKCLLTGASEVSASNHSSWGKEKAGVRQRDLIFPLSEQMFLQLQYCFITNEEDFAASFHDRNAIHLDGAQSLVLQQVDDKPIKSSSGVAQLVGMLFDRPDLEMSGSSLLQNPDFIAVQEQGCHFYFASGEPDGKPSEHQATRICLELRLRKDFSILALVLRLPTPLFHELIVRAESVAYSKMISQVSFLGEFALWLKLESTCADIIVLEKGE